MRTLIATIVLFAGQAAGAAPISTPVTAITDPVGISSPRNESAKPVPLDDLAAVRGSYGAAWAPDGKSLVVSPNLTGRYNLWRVVLGGNFPIQLTNSNVPQAP